MAEEAREPGVTPVGPPASRRARPRTRHAPALPRAAAARLQRQSCQLALPAG